MRRPLEGVAAMDLVVEGVHCGACISAIEKGLGKQAGVRGARVNLASKRVTVEWSEGALEPPEMLGTAQVARLPRLSVRGRCGRRRENAAEKRRCDASASRLSPR